MNKKLFLLTICTLSASTPVCAMISAPELTPGQAVAAEVAVDVLKYQLVGRMRTDRSLIRRSVYYIVRLVSGEAGLTSFMNIYAEKLVKRPETKPLIDTSIAIYLEIPDVQQMTAEVDAALSDKTAGEAQALLAQLKSDLRSKVELALGSKLPV